MRHPHRCASNIAPRLRRSEGLRVSTGRFLPGWLLIHALTSGVRAGLSRAMAISVTASQHPRRDSSVGIGASTHLRRCADAPSAPLVQTGDRLWLDQATTDRVAGEVRDASHLKLRKDVRAVVIHGLAADHQIRGDLVAGVALRDQLDDLNSRGVSGSLGAASPRRACSRYSRTSATIAFGYRNGSPRMAARHASTRSRLAADLRT